MVMSTEHGNYICMTSSFLKGDLLKDSAVILAACESAKYNMAKDFLSHGVRAIIGCSREVYSDSDNFVNEMMLAYMCHGLSFRRAFDYVINSEKTQKATNALKGVYDMLEWGALDVVYNYWRNNSDPYFLMDPFPYNLDLSVNNNSVALSWDCDLDSFTVSWNDHLDGLKWVTKDYSYDLRYDLYIDDNLVARDIDGTKKTWDISTSLNYKSWYVVAKIMEGDEVVESFQSEIVFQPDAIDLGLSVNWASCNLGASSPDECGDYYAWGETKTHYRSLNPLIWKADMEGYYWNTYSLCKFFEGVGATIMTKYLEDPRYEGYGFDNKLVLDLEDDAAHAKLGGQWRMPTVQEFGELSACTWIKSSYNGRSGFMVIGPNGNSIFLPAAGEFYKTNLLYVGERGFYWTSSRRQASYQSQEAYYVKIQPKPFSADAKRYYGYTIRPICEK